MMKSRIDPNRFTIWTLCATSAVILGVLYGTAISASGEPIEKTRVVTEHVLDRNEVDVPSVPPECLLALEQADKVFSQAYRFTSPKTVNREDKKDIKEYLDRLAPTYTQNKEICEEMGH